MGLWFLRQYLLHIFGTFETYPGPFRLWYDPSGLGQIEGDPGPIGATCIEGAVEGESRDRVAGYSDSVFGMEELRLEGLATKA